MVPVPPKKSAGAYVKFGRRKAMEIALLGAAVFLVFDEGNKCSEAGVALTTAAPTPVRSPKAEAVLKGAVITEEVLEEAGRQANEDAAVRTSWRSTAQYRRELVPVLVRRAGMLALERHRAGQAFSN